MPHSRHFAASPEALGIDPGGLQGLLSDGQEATSHYQAALMDLDGDGTAESVVPVPTNQSVDDSTDKGAR